MKTRESVEKHDKWRGSSGFTRDMIVLVFLIALLAVPQLRAATTVNCLVDGEVWDASGSPYLVNCDVTVSALTIQPGVEVRFLSNYAFMVEGILKVEGAVAPNQVRFTTTNSAVGWKGIWFSDSPAGSFFNNCIIEHSSYSGVRITNTAPVGGSVPAFTNCTIVNNFTPDYGGGIIAILKSGTLKMVQCSIVSNIANVAVSYYGAGGGIYVSGNSVLLNCLIGDNLSNGQGQFNVTCGASYGGGVYSGTGNASFRNCRFERNIARTFDGSTHCSPAYGGAVYFGGGHLTLQNCIVDTNTCSDAWNIQGAGIFVTSGTADINNCTIIGNNTQGLFAAGGTVNCLNSILYFNNGAAAQIGGTVTATYCDIQGAYAGVGNIASGPVLRADTHELLSTSPCIDTGNPDPLYNDACFPPSKGTVLNDMGAFGGPSACCWSNICPPPTPVTITHPPDNFTTCVGSSAMFCVTAIGDPPLTYHWSFHGTNINNLGTNVLGGTNACLMISNVQSNNAGYYSVLVANAGGSALSSRALLTITPICVDICLYPGLTLTGGVTGQVYRVQYVTNVNDTTWTTLTTITQKVAGVFVLDPQCANLQRRFYRVVP